MASNESNVGASLSPNPTVHGFRFFECENAGLATTLPDGGTSVPQKFAIGFYPHLEPVQEGNDKQFPSAISDVPDDAFISGRIEIQDLPGVGVLTYLVSVDSFEPGAFGTINGFLSLKDPIPQTFHVCFDDGVSRFKTDDGWDCRSLFYTVPAPGVNLNDRLPVTSTTK